MRTLLVDGLAEVLEGDLFVLGPADGAFDGDALVFIPLAARSRETSVCGRPEQFLHLQELTAPPMSHAACSMNSFVDRKRILLPVIVVRAVRSERDKGKTLTNQVMVTSRALRFALFVAIECILVRPASENIVLTRYGVSEQGGAELRPKDVRGNCSTAAAPVPTSTRQRIASGSSGPM